MGATECDERGRATAAQCVEDITNPRPQAPTQHKLCRRATRPSFERQEEQLARRPRPAPLAPSYNCIRISSCSQLRAQYSASTTQARAQHNTPAHETHRTSTPASRRAFIPFSYDGRSPSVPGPLPGFATATTGTPACCASIIFCHSGAAGPAGII